MGAARLPTLPSRWRAHQAALPASDSGTSCRPTRRFSGPLVARTLSVSPSSAVRRFASILGHAVSGSNSSASGPATTVKSIGAPNAWPTALRLTGPPGVDLDARLLHLDRGAVATHRKREGSGANGKLRLLHEFAHARALRAQQDLQSLDRAARRVRPIRRAQQRRHVDGSALAPASTRHARPLASSVTWPCTGSVGDRGGCQVDGELAAPQLRERSHLADRHRCARHAGNVDIQPGIEGTQRRQRQGFVEGTARSWFRHAAPSLATSSTAMLARPSICGRPSRQRSVPSPVTAVPASVAARPCRRSMSSRQRIRPARFLMGTGRPVMASIRTERSASTRWMPRRITRSRRRPAAGLRAADSSALTLGPIQVQRAEASAPR